MYTKRRKTFAGLAAAAFLLVALCSLLFLVRETTHDCSGEGCQICACIYQAKQTLKELGTGGPIAAFCEPVQMQTELVLACVFFSLPCITLISQKIRLND